MQTNYKISSLIFRAVFCTVAPWPSCQLQILNKRTSCHILVKPVMWAAHLVTPTRAVYKWRLFVGRPGRGVIQNLIMQILHGFDNEVGFQKLPLTSFEHDPVMRSLAFAKDRTDSSRNKEGIKKMRYTLFQNWTYNLWLKKQNVA